MKIVCPASHFDKVEIVFPHISERRFESLICVVTELLAQARLAEIGSAGGDDENCYIGAGGVRS